MGVKKSPSKDRRDPRTPVAVWHSKDLFRGCAEGSLTVILRTRGCSWRRCLMCGYPQEGVPATSEDILFQFRKAMEQWRPEERMVKIYTSGSFLDSREVSESARKEILEDLADRGVARLVIESRPEHISREKMESSLSFLEVEVGIGLETSSDLVRDAMGKGFTFADFVRASETVRSVGGRVKAYLMLKPPFLSEGEAIKDAIASARNAYPYADILSLNLCNVQRGTPLERMWERGEYRPPWLWSALEVLKNSPSPIICDPVGAGAKRGPHNCGECDGAVAEAIRKHAITQDLEAFQGMDCPCKAAWKKVLELDDLAFGTLLV